MTASTLTQTDKAMAFHALHAGAGCFVIPNPWDVGSARLLEAAGFRALASSSAGLAFSLGQPDGLVGRDVLLQYLAALCAGSSLPVSADLENGFGDAPEAAAQTVTLAAAAGVVGGSIEDSTGLSDAPLHEIAHAAERIRAAAEAARALPFPFVVTARAENFVLGRPDLADTIARLQAYQEAGADVLFAPGLRTVEEIALVLREIDRPLNVLLGLGPLRASVPQLAALGVKRISTGGSLARVAWGAFMRAVDELQQGGCGYLAQAASHAELCAAFAAFPAVAD
ncbi:2-Methylisocitrate lyase, PEP mutase family [Andreprevotia lacus DSM 23236]|jgi:2-methylisocitrate lyase-like PEP mutase family enzyme|uniref:2-Methylisocitrate lyase, PEP mutase family n=1 Tax=Andreprevotia lacus DSM 23236 TaxID=1121001 RepID=A0A1W1XZ99_9NEIS|nr:isocitrate lyase/phosphoenolpyruvate mutase family protein [Andreprevotia lacus]SMC29204.1 2-Methylisocitrate lyase, PEP mutase family [Andreprevotia lacus DSM 23236]